MKTIEFTYNSVSEFGDAVHSIHALPRNNKYRLSNDNTWQDDTPHTLNEAIKIACDGGYWAEGGRQLQQITVDADSDKDYIRRVIVKDVTGFMPNIPALLAGHPQAMFNQKPGPKRRRYLKIGVGGSMSGSVPAQPFYNRGRAIMAVIDDLVTQGYGVELWTVCGAVTRGQLVALMSVRVKPADGQWSYDVAAFMLACSSISRRLFFRLLESNAKLMKLIGQGYGIPITTAPEGYDVWFPSLTSREDNNYGTPKKALHTVADKVQDYLRVQSNNDYADNSVV